MENNEQNWQFYLLRKLKQEWSDKSQIAVFLGKIPSKPKMPHSVSPFLTFILGVTSALGPLPDASQEGILWSWKGYGSVALFHYNVIIFFFSFFKTWFSRLFQQIHTCFTFRFHMRQLERHGSLRAFRIRWLPNFYFLLCAMNAARCL